MAPQIRNIKEKINQSQSFWSQKDIRLRVHSQKKDSFTYQNNPPNWWWDSWQNLTVFSLLLRFSTLQAPYYHEKQNKLTFSFLLTLGFVYLHLFDSGKTGLSLSTFSSSFCLFNVKFAFAVTLLYLCFALVYDFMVGFLGST